MVQACILRFVSSGKPVFILNARAGSELHADALQRIKTICAESGVEPRFITCDERLDIRAAAQDAIRLDPCVVVAGGGDGSINAVASAVLETGIPLGVLPLGTLNHFAKDVGIPLDMDLAIRTALAGNPVQVDAGEVNGRIFVNNSSLGVYPNVVEERDREQRRGARKWPAFARALISVLRRYPLMRVRFTFEGQHVERETPIVFIGNNPYELSGLDAGSRKRLDSGELFVITSRTVSRRALLWSALRALFGGADGSALEVFTARELWICGNKYGRFRVATDGEVTFLEAPLHYCIRPRALTVMVPRAAKEKAA